MRLVVAFQYPFVQQGRLSQRVLAFHRCAMTLVEVPEYAHHIIELVFFQVIHSLFHFTVLNILHNR